MQQHKIPKRLFINGDLHFVLRVNRAEDLILAWSYPEHKRKTYVWSDVQKRAQKAFKPGEVGKMLGRKYWTMYKYQQKELIRKPQMSYNIQNGNPGRFYFSEDDVLEIFDYLKTVHRGQPRKDGTVNSWNLPSKAELKAMMGHGTMTYIKDDKGEYIPIWKSHV